ncbi:MAG: hypothetical protein JWP75_2834 [Frondihabitans sp.]|nr:hypothetical protein [Frondihabitans sp.]
MTVLLVTLILGAALLAAALLYIEPLLLKILLSIVGICILVVSGVTLVRLRASHE